MSKCTVDLSYETGVMAVNITKDNSKYSFHNKAAIF